MASLESVLAVNGQGDEQEPWCAADDNEIIEIDGADIVALLDDAVVGWINNERCWVEIEPSNAARWIERVYEGGMAGRMGGVDAAQKLRDALAEVWEGIRPLSEYVSLSE